MSFGPFCNNPQKDRGIPAVQAVTECLIVMVFESPTHNNEQYIVCRDNQKWRQMELLRLDAFLPAHNKTHRGVFAHKNRRDWKKKREHFKNGSYQAEKYVLQLQTVLSKYFSQQNIRPKGQKNFETKFISAFWIIFFIIFLQYIHRHCKSLRHGRLKQRFCCWPPSSVA